MLTLKSVTKAYSGLPLFLEAGLQVNRGDCVGVVGANGAGKSTLFSVIMGEVTPDEGEVLLERGVQTGFLPQESAATGSETVLELTCTGSSEYVGLLKQINALDHGGDSLADHEVEGLRQRFEELGGHGLAARARQILAGMGFNEKDHDRPAYELSGGWIMRAHLASLLVREPDLLMLDEPTNHLDLHSLLWLQGFLKNYHGAVLLISHDRELLNNLAGSIVEIGNTRLTRYKGNYDQYRIQREAEAARHEAAYNNQQKEIARLMKFVDRFRAKNTKATQAQSKLKQIDRMELIQAPPSARTRISFSFPQPERSGHRVIELKAIQKSYGPLRVYENLDLEIIRGQCVVLVGPNGAGKSTLLKILAGVLPFDSGERNLGYKVNLGYFAQHRIEILTPENTVLEEVLSASHGIPEQTARTLLGCFLFRQDDVFKRVKVLSGGEKSRLAMARILLSPPNFLLLDEPTTHLDMDSIETMIEALGQYKGTLVFISHDVHFIKSIANHVIHVEHGRLRHYPGGYGYYLDKMAEENGSGVGMSAIIPRKGIGDESGKREMIRARKRREAEQRQALAKQRRQQKAIVEKLENRIEQLEMRQKELTALLEDPAAYEKGGQAVQFNRELTGVVAELGECSVQWEAEATKLGALTQEQVF